MNATTRKLIARSLKAIRAAAQSARTLAAHALTTSAEHLVRHAARTLAYTTDQINKAVELIEDGGIHQLRNRIWLAVSTDGTRVHRCTAAACTCEAGVKATRTGRPCYHSLAATALEAA